MVIRIWHGRTKPENADKYEQLLKQKVFPEIAAKALKGYKGIQLLKRKVESRVEFITIMGFVDMATIKEFAGEDYEKSYVITEAKMLLEEYDSRARHFELVENLLHLPPFEGMEGK